MREATSASCPHCTGPHSLSQCPTWRLQSGLLPLLDAYAAAAIDAHCTGGDFGTARAFGAAEDALLDRVAALFLSGAGLKVVPNP